MVRYVSGLNIDVKDCRDTWHLMVIIDEEKTAGQLKKTCSQYLLNYSLSQIIIVQNYCFHFGESRPFCI